MKNLNLIVLSCVFCFSACKTKQHKATCCDHTEKSCCEKDKSEDYSFINKSFWRADSLYNQMITNHPDPTLIPRSMLNTGEIDLVKYNDWTSGFFAGSMWHLYEYTGSDTWKSNAIKWTEALESVKNLTTTHDVGFMMYCSYGNGFRLTGDKKYEQILNETSQTLSSRFNPIVGCTKSWNKYEFSKKWQYPVIIDNMMNLELLFFSAKSTGNKNFYNIADTHTKTTIKNHFRPDFSSYHVVDYDSLTGNIIQKNTHQGLYDHSSWSRGQGWGLYGFTISFRETKNPAYLEQAKNIANYIINYPSLPADKIPLWDYFDKSPNAPRDASAAAIIASALLELSTFVEPELSNKYIQFATESLKSLSSDKYLNTVGNNNNFIILHCTGNYPDGTEIDKPINYGDYYFLEALLKLKKIKNIR